MKKQQIYVIECTNNKVSSWIANSSREFCNAVFEKTGGIYQIYDTKSIDDELTFDSDNKNDAKAIELIKTEGKAVMYGTESYTEIESIKTAPTDFEHALMLLNADCEAHAFTEKDLHDCLNDKKYLSTFSKIAREKLLSFLS